MKYLERLLRSWAKWANVKTKPLSSVVMSSGEAFNGISQSLCSIQEVGSSSLSLVMTQSDKRFENKAEALTQPRKTQHHIKLADIIVSKYRLKDRSTLVFCNKALILLKQATRVYIFETKIFNYE